MANRLYFGDNLGWLRNRDEFPNDSVDLVYLDPPFNSNADYYNASPARIGLRRKSVNIISRESEAKPMKSWQNGSCGQG